MLKFIVQDGALWLFQVYAHNATSESQCSQCYDKVNDALSRVANFESIVLLIDFNAHVETIIETWKGVIGRHEIAGSNEKIQYLLQIGFNNGCSVTNIFSSIKLFKITRYTDQSSGKNLL